MIINNLKKKNQNKDRDRNVCWYCGGNLVWENDYDLKDVHPESEKDGIVTYLRCSDCGADVEYISEEDDPDEKIDRKN